jgi:hypothetical protein
MKTVPSRGHLDSEQAEVDFFFAELRAALWIDFEWQRKATII